jgi:hypothetical protein
MNVNVLRSEHLAWLPSFFNDNLAFDHYEILTVNKVPLKDRKKESELMASKWFDYRLMHPMMATYYFYHLYVQEFQAFLAKTVNRDTATFIFPFKGEARFDFLKAREALSIWRLRQQADLLGIRYEFFLKTAFNKMYRMIANGRVVPPRPAMFNKVEFLSEIHIEWEAMCKAVIQFACSPYFTVSCFENSLMQLDYESYMVRQVWSRRIPYYSLSACLHKYEAIRIERAFKEFDPQTIQLAINESVEFLNAH